MTPCHTNKKNKFKNKRYYYYRCTSTLRYDWNNCPTKQVSADRLEKYIFDNFERIAIDKQYLDGLAFRLNSGVSGGLSGFELSSESPKISPEIVSHTLTHLTKTLPQKRGVEKNIFVKKFIKDIIYSPSQIKINLYYSDIYEENNYSFFGVEGNKTERETAKQFPFPKPELLVRDAINGSPLNLNSNFVPIFFPNLIHACKKKNL